MPRGRPAERVRMRAVEDPVAVRAAGGGEAGREVLGRSLRGVDHDLGRQELGERASKPVGIYRLPGGEGHDLLAGVDPGISTKQSWPAGQDQREESHIGEADHPEGGSVVPVPLEDICGGRPHRSGHQEGPEDAGEDGESSTDWRERPELRKDPGDDDHHYRVACCVLVEEQRLVERPIEAAGTNHLGKHVDLEVTASAAKKASGRGALPPGGTARGGQVTPPKCRSALLSSKLALGPDSQEPGSVIRSTNGNGSVTAGNRSPSITTSNSVPVPAYATSTSTKPRLAPNRGE